MERPKMAYNKIEKFAKTNKTAQEYLDENDYFGAWITYIREADKTAETIVDDIDQECNIKKSPLTDGEKCALQIEAMDYMRMRKWEEN